MLYNMVVRLALTIWYILTVGYLILNLKQIFTNKKAKNILITVCEILVVAGIIFGVLMLIYSKINKDASQIGNVSQSAEDTETRTTEEGSDEYYIEVNIRKNAMIVYQYAKDKKTKTPYKIFKCSVGSQVKKGSYQTSNNYSWLNINGGWHKYNTQFDTKSWIQSAEYRDKYDNTLNKKSYNAIGEKQESGSCILLYARDAGWIYENCSKTEINIIKGKKSDKLPLEFEPDVKAVKYCGWDPTDSDANNPYQKISNGKIVLGLPEVYVEKGDEPEYLSNLLARDENGKNIAASLKYKTIDTGNTGTYKVRYTYKTDAGNKLKAVQKFTVIDTTSPVVTCSKSLFTFEVDSLEPEDMNKESNVKEIQNLVRSSVSCNESDVTITVSCPSAEELKEGKIPVVVKVQDSSGNVGSCQVMCEITVKEEETEKETKSKKRKTTIQNVNEETTGNNEEITKKKKNQTGTKQETTKTSSENRDEDTTTVNE